MNNNNNNNNNNNKNLYKATTQLEQTLLHRVEELEQINLRLQSDNEARILAQEGLRYGQKFLREVISSVEDSFFTVFDQNCLINFVWGSKKLEQKYGIIFQDYMGKDSNIISPILEKEIRKVFETNQSFHGEWCEDRQGNIVWWDFMLSPIRDEDNEMVAVVSAARDITESKKKEEKLRLNSQIMTNLSEGVTLVRLEDEVIVYTNPTFDEMFGYNPGEIIGKSVAIVDAPIKKTPDETNREIKQILLDTGEWHGEVRNIKKNGQIFWCYANISLFDHPEHGRVRITVQTDITVRKKAEDDLKDSEEILKGFMDSATDGLIIFDPNLNYIEANNVTAQTAGLTKEELIGKNILDVIPNLKEIGRYDKYLDVLKTGEPFSTEDVIYNRLDGTLNAHLSIRAFKVGSNLGMIFTDITDRKKIENMLRESEEKFSKTFNNAPIMLAISTVKDGKFIDVNTSFLDKLGYNREEILGMTSDDLNLFVNYEQREKIIQLTKDNGYVRNFEMKARCKTGEIIDGLFSSEVVQLLDSDYLVTTMSDVTESKKIEEKLRKSEERYRLIAENANENIWSYDLNLNRTYSSRTGKEVLGYTTEEYKNMKISDYTLPDSYEILVKDLASELEYDKKHRDIHRVRKFDAIKQRHKEGHIVISELIVTFLRDADGNPTGILGMSRDITERKKSEELLKRSEEKYRNLFNKAHVGIFSSRLSDGKCMECNEYLASIMGYDTIGEVLEEYIGIEHYVNLDDREKILELVKKNGYIENQELELTKKDGTPYWTNYSVSLDLERQRLEGVVIDITERREAEQKLRENERILNEAQAIAHIGHFYLDTITLEVSGSDELFKIFGLTTKENNLDAFAGVVHPDDRDFVLSHIQRGMTEGVRYYIEHRLLLNDGTEKWIHAIGEALKDDTGKINFLIGTVQDITDLKKAILKLSESEKLYGSFVKNYGGIAYRGGMDQVPIFFHGAVEEITGYTEKEFTEGRLPWFSLSHPDDLPSEELMYKMLNIPGYSAQREYRIYRKDGQIRWIFDSGQNVVDNEGKIIAVEGTLNDITDLKRTEEALRENEGIMRSILANSPDYILMVDKECKIQFINRSLFGENMEDIVNCKISAIIQPEYRELVEDRINQVFSRGKTENIKVSFSNQKTGTKSLYEIRFGYIKSNWEIIAVILIMTDITEQFYTDKELKEVQKELFDSKERFKNVIELSPIPITIISSINGKYEYFNPKTVEKFGYTMNEIPTIYDWFEKVHPDEKYRKKIINAWKKSLTKIKTQKINPSTLNVRTKDGNVLTILFKMVYLGDNRIMFTVEDITALK